VPIAIEELDRYVDLRRLEDWMDDRGLGRGLIQDGEILAGGTQNILLKFTRDGRGYVLRRPPHDPYMNGSETIRREIRVLEALAGTDVPHARLIASCGTEDVLGAAFYLMEPVDGFSPVRGLPLLHQARPAIRHEMGLSLIDALVTLHRVDPAGVGLADFGKPAAYLARQIARLVRQLESYAAYEGWTGGAEIPGVEKVAAWLVTHMPAEAAPGIVHGDFHMGNAMFSKTGPEVRAVVDWELATTGDSACDLGCLLATWAEPDGLHPGCIEIAPWDGFPTEAELVRRYTDGIGRAVDANWYAVFGCLRLGILLEGTYARAQAGKADMETGVWLHRTAINLLNRALRRLS
jgi:aminoglycoside phosphotransferase (APT) family kinase protein